MVWRRCAAQQTQQEVFGVSSSIIHDIRYIGALLLSTVVGAVYCGPIHESSARMISLIPGIYL